MYNFFKYLKMNRKSEILPIVKLFNTGFHEGKTL